MFKCGFACKDKLQANRKKYRRVESAAIANSNQKIAWIGLEPKIVFYTSVLLCLPAVLAAHNVTSSASPGLYFSISKFRTRGAQDTPLTQITIKTTMIY